MKLFSNILTLSLVLAIGAEMFGIEIYRAPKPPVERTAGCHGRDGRSSPHAPRSSSRLPAPVNYRCCVMGHGAAFVQAAHFVQPSIEISGLNAQVNPVLAVSGISRLEVGLVFFSESPGLSPLRI